MTSRRAADGGGGRLALAGADRRQALGDPVGRRDEEVPGAGRGVDDGELEDRPLGLLLGRLVGRLVEDRVERRVEQDVDQARRRVVGAGRLALVAGGRRERERGGFASSSGCSSRSDS